MATPPRDIAVLHHMRDTGGGFVQSLATAWMRADPNNQELLHGAFGWIYNQYRDALYSTEPATDADAADAVEGEPLLEGGAA